LRPVTQLHARTTLTGRTLFKNHKPALHATECAPEQQAVDENSSYIDALGTMRISDLMQELSQLKWDMRLFENEILFNAAGSKKVEDRRRRTFEKLCAVEKQIRIRTGLDHE
jgi:hypothetical protein